MTAIKQPLSNLQLELLKAFSHHLNEEDLKALKKVIANFFAQKAINSANKVWDEKGWTDKDVDRMLHTKMRKSKK